ncbi:MAG: hypothetical protein V1833_03525 [Elusimicrobiota bacterium]
MNQQKLESLNRLYFTCKDVASVFDISYGSARVSCSRYVKNGYFVRLKRNFYVLAEKWKTLTEKDFYFVANMFQVPSYISLSSALSYYDVTTQIQQNFIESVAIKRTIKKEIGKQIFNYTKISPKLYFGFMKINNFFISTKEKALLDAVYLSSLNRYNLDISAIDLNKLDKRIIKKWLKKYPAKTISYMEKIWKI